VPVMSVISILQRLGVLGDVKSDADTSDSRALAFLSMTELLRARC
jgi:hypothetical protein